MSYVRDERLVVAAAQSERAAFIRRTYGHLAGAILAFAALEMVLLKLPGIEQVVIGMAGSAVTWLLVVGAFIGVGWLANMWALSGTSRALQYTGLALYVVAEAVIFLPLLYLATFVAHDKTLIPTAGIMTLAMFGGLTLAVFTTQKDFSFLGPILSVCSFLAMGLVVAFMFTGGNFTFGLVISFLMVAVASGAILYHTSNVLHHYRTDQHVAAALALFASVATLFYYILYILLAASERR